MPEYEFKTDRDLLTQCWLAKEISGGQIYHPEFIKSLPAHYLDELALFGQGVKFFEDEDKRDPMMR